MLKIERNEETQETTETTVAFGHEAEHHFANLHREEDDDDDDEDDNDQEKTLTAGDSSKHVEENESQASGKMIYSRGSGGKQTKLDKYFLFTKFKLPLYHAKIVMF